MLIDPSPAPLQSPPRDEAQWVHQADGRRVVVVDNTSVVPDWWSDALCRAVTGEAFVHRKLYTDGDLHVVRFRRVIMLTAIDLAALRGDLGDRLCLVDLEPIKDSNRKLETELTTWFNDHCGRILGGLLDKLVGVLRYSPETHLASAPRMADFAHVLAALDRADPADVSALDIYLSQRSRIAGTVVDSDPVAGAIIELLERENGRWSGTATELLSAIATDGRPPRGWPTSPQQLGARLKRLIPALERVGIIVDRGKDSDRQRTRRIHLTMDRGGPSDSAAGFDVADATEGPMEVDNVWEWPALHELDDADELSRAKAHSEDEWGEV